MMILWRCKHRRLWVHDQCGETTTGRLHDSVTCSKNCVATTTCLSGYTTNNPNMKKIPKLKKSNVSRLDAKCAVIILGMLPGTSGGNSPKLPFTKGLVRYRVSLCFAVHEMQLLPICRGWLFLDHHVGHQISSHRLIFYSLKTVVKRNCVQNSYTCAYNKTLTNCTLWVKKTRHYNIVHNFAKCWPIFKLLSLTDSLVNLQQND